MKKVTILAAVAAILCGLLLYTYLNQVEDRVNRATAAAKEDPDLKPVVVAIQDIPAYTAITDEEVAIYYYPSAYVNENAATELDQVIGFQYDGTTYAGEILFKNGLTTEEDSGSSLSYRIPEGMRAMTISVSTSQGVGGYLTVGDTVDVIQYLAADETETIQTDGGATRTINGGVVNTVLEGVQILALGDPWYTGEDGTYSTVTLLLEPEQCAILTAGDGMGASFCLSLRQRGISSHEYDSITTYPELNK